MTGCITTHHAHLLTKKIERHGKKYEKTQAEETKQSSGPDSDVTQIIEILDGEFQITMINMLNTLMEKKKLGGTEGWYKQTTGNLKKKIKRKC